MLCVELYTFQTIVNSAYITPLLQNSEIFRKSLVLIQNYVVLRLCDLHKAHPNPCNFNF